MINKYSDFLKENNSDFDFKQIFLALTEYTVPFGYEKYLEPILYNIVPGLRKDGFGNYHIKIGDSKTLFTSHLDTYSKRREKVNHVVKGGKISTDGTTVLGGDNKNGVVILLYMILNQVPGTYYFFRGEEGVVTGKSCNGSNWLLKNNSKIYTSMDRAIAFDRRGKGSIVTKQRGRECCSTDFADALVGAFGTTGLEFKQDYAYGTDSAVFMDIVPEITNISSGGEYEHAFLESTNINYTRKVAIAATQIDWEALPTTREPKPVDTNYGDREWNATTHSVNKRVFKKIQSLLGTEGFNCINSANFKPSAVMHFRQYTGDKFIDLRVINRKAFIVNDNFFDEEKEIIKFTPLELKEILELDVETMSKRVIGRITNTMGSDYKLTRGKLNTILNKFNLTYVDFKEFIDNSDDYKDLFVFGDTEIEMDIIANQAVTINKQKEQEKKK